MSLPLQVCLVFVGIFAVAVVVAVGASGIVGAVSTARVSDGAVTVASAAAELIRGPIPVCHGGDREARRVTCIVDGDTGWIDGRKWRLVARSGGVDAPELNNPECSDERAVATIARDRLRSLMSYGYSMERDGEDRNGRALVRIRLADGRDAGDVLIAAGLAQTWPNQGNVWCER